MRLIYKCPFVNKVILERDFPLPEIITETPCPYCNEDHPLPICPREMKNDE